MIDSKVRDDGQQDRRIRGGGKLMRSETVTVRLDPKLRYLAELAARKQRRTLSSFIEWAIEDALKRVQLYQGGGYGGDESVTVEEDATRLWDVDDAERFARLAILYPDLLTYEEQQIWKLLSDSLLLEPAKIRTKEGNLRWHWPTLEDRVFATLRGHWASLLAVATRSRADQQEWVERRRSEKAAPKVQIDSATKKSTAADLDDDIPF